MPFIGGLPATETLGKVPPRYARPDPEQDPVDYAAVVAPPPATLSEHRQVWLQPSPLRIRQITPPYAEKNEPSVRQSHDPPERA